MKFSEAVALVEANELGRFISKHSNGEYAVVSACRGELSKAENYKRTKELKEKLQASRFSFKPVKGGYIENLGKSNQKEVYENSFMIYGYSKNGEPIKPKELFNYAIKLCKEYEQDSILYSKHGEKPTYYNKNGSKEFSPGKNMKLNDKSQEYFSEFGKNKRFSLTQ